MLRSSQKFFLLVLVLVGTASSFLSKLPSRSVTRYALTTDVARRYSMLSATDKQQEPPEGVVPLSEDNKHLMIESLLDKKLEPLVLRLEALNQSFASFRRETRKKIFRKELVKEHGTYFVQDIVVEELTTLAGLAAGFRDQYPSRDQQLEKQESNANRLVDYIYSHKETALARLSDKYFKKFDDAAAAALLSKYLFADPSTISPSEKDSIERIYYSQSIDPAIRWLCKFALMDDIKSRKSFLRSGSNGLGIILLSAAADLEPFHRIEIECEGFVQDVHTYGFLVRVGKIAMSPEEIPAAITEFGRSLALLEVAIGAIHPTTAPTAGTTATKTSTGTTKKRSSRTRTTAGGGEEEGEKEGTAGAAPADDESSVAEVVVSCSKSGVIVLPKTAAFEGVDGSVWELAKQRGFILNIKYL